MWWLMINDEQLLLSRRITEGKRNTRTTTEDEINWNKRHQISQDLIKQLHKQHQIDFISVRLLEKLLLRINRGLDAL